ncbi:MAG: histidinol dehydrogenase [Hyphomicrobiales bacterium]|nr:histidinol dehydrogenase [Hyphomicrobiales bacterium]PCJ88486.1 MAG: histidinol dehydrogenase [Hyphomicrobiales bacterium]
MVYRLNQNDADFDAGFAEMLAAKREISADVDETVRGILADVRSRGDAAVIELTKKFDRLELTSDTIKISQAEIDEAVASVEPEIMDALRFAHDRITSHHEKQVPQNQRYTDELGVELGYRWSAISAVGLYVPGGTANYPSSVLMNAVPARVAGVKRIAMVVPTPGGVLNPLVLVAADLAGVTEIYRIGGAQAIAALAYGTDTIAAVAKIVGPGNAYVAAAKRQVFGIVGIDMVAGPSEVLVVADDTANPDWVAADLLAQAEHDTAAQSMVITDSAAFAKEVEKSVEAQLKDLPRAEIAGASWKNYGAIIQVPDVTKAISLIDAIAAEHLELCVADPDALFDKITHAGAVFLGHHTPEVIGDYVGGSNHVLPTARSARFSSGLSVLDYMKKTSILKCNADNLRALAPAAIRLADVEGLSAHARSVAIRLNL